MQPTLKNDSLRRLAGLVSSKQLQLIVLPTEACNFRCTYCYEDFELGRMSAETVLGVKRLLSTRVPELDSLIVSWFGGEPLVAKDLVLEISRHIVDLTSSNRHIVYKAGMTTNGWFLDSETAAELLEVGVTDFQISLDGPAELHNNSRLSANGSGTFETIWQNLHALRDSGLEVNVLLRVHFDARTVTRLDPFIEELRREFLRDKRFTASFQAIQKLGGPNDDALDTLSEEEAQAAKSRLGRLAPQSAVKFGDPGDYVCYAAKPNSLVIRSDGSVGKCTVALADDRNRVGTLRPDGTLEIAQEKLSPWLRGLARLDPEILSCPLKGMREESPLRVL